LTNRLFTHKFSSILSSLVHANLLGMAFYRYNSNKECKNNLLCGDKRTKEC
jgi:hypothetical protein